ncbi:MAG TPA: N-acetylmannosamine-6-phosphate 2-epimerase [Streptosporangiaceae bacterium]|nr:N-acetylmannosamine-6-phosphate 2-epimerase [Streptosporangiaceae bacterium]
METAALIESLRGGLIVSCQALPEEPLFGAQHMAAMARAAAQGGAVAIRANGEEDIAAIRGAVTVPVIGLIKEDLPGFEVRITPTLGHAERIARAGAEVIALDATRRPRPDNLSVKEMIDGVHRLGKPVLADVSTLDEGLDAARFGAELVATTLSGYTAYSPASSPPDLDLLERLASELKPIGTPVIAEGRITTPRQAVEALARGAHAVVVGGAITRPQWITAQFASAIREARAA